MKKLLITFTVILAVCWTGSAQSISVTTPQPDSKWTKGTPMTIKWNSPGCDGGNVIINIFKNSISQANFVLQLTGSNSGSKIWNIPPDFASGTFYLRIKKDPAMAGCVGDSGPFYIKLNATLVKVKPKISTNKGLKFGKMLNKIKVWKPETNSSHEAKKVMVVSWKTDFAQYTKINMDLHRQDGSLAMSLLKEYNNCGSIGWAPPEKYAVPGMKYYIHIYTTDKKYSGVSGSFTVTPPGNNN